MAILDNGFYKGNDQYSDGDEIENYLLEIVKKDKTITDLKTEQVSWPILYHLSPIRENICNWYDFSGARVLEIGAGCGSITGTLCRQASKVCSVDLSMRRCSINFERHKHCDNLHIYAGNLNDIHFSQPFDYILLIGVLEYAGRFTEGENPYRSFLENIKKRLKPGGKLLIAIENRFGLKYFSGAEEDHLGGAFTGIRGYDDNDGVKTFSQAEIQKLLKDSGFNYSRFYYPYPDYKFPIEIFTDETLKTMNYGKPYQVFDKERYVFFSEQQTSFDLIRDNQVGCLANSFLIETGEEDFLDKSHTIYAKINNDRKKEFCISTQIIKDNEKLFVKKSAVNKEAETHIRNIVENDNKLEQYHNVVTGTLYDNYILYPFIDLLSLDDLLREAIEARNIDYIIYLFEQIKCLIEINSRVCDYNSPEFVEWFGPDKSDNPIMCCVSPGNIDLLPDNVFQKDGELFVTDCEWITSFPVPLHFILWRSIDKAYVRYSNLSEIISEEDILSHFDIRKEDIPVFQAWSFHFENSYVSKNNCSRFGKKVELVRNDIVSYSFDLQNQLNTISDHSLELQNQLNDEIVHSQNLQDQLNTISDHSLELQNQLNDEIIHSQNLQDQLNTISDYSLELQNHIKREIGHSQHLQDQLDNETERNQDLMNQMILALNELFTVKNLLQKTVENYEAELRSSRAELETRLSVLKNTEKDISQAVNYSTSLLPRRSMQLMHLVNRWKYQRGSSNAEERKEFWNWFNSRFSNKVTDTRHKYQPLYNIIDPLEERQNELSDFIDQAEKKQLALPQAGSSGNKEPIKGLPDRKIEFQCSTLNDPYRKFDIIIFSVIDYDFRYQRPQQIADHFVREGHRVFYINGNFNHNNEIFVENRNGLYIVSLPNTIHNAIYSTDFSDDGINLQEKLDQLVIQEGIRDCLLIADYPTWVSGILYLQKKYGFRVAVDYMDDYMGFLNTAESFVETSCMTLLKNSDVVIASSSYLTDAAKPYNNNVVTVRNGTEFSHFHRAFGKKPKKQTIGYYGAIAHWFDVDKIKYLSKRFPNIDIILIGDVTAGGDELKKLSNVKLLGEKPYKDLPEYLAEFSVCLIPFDASTSLIQATNPVKFYEYLSAGKKIVATEILELEPFRDRFVYLANDNKKFGNYVELCLKGKDTLATAEECAEFARMNDWSERVRQFSIAAEKVFPKISIIVLCYNQVDYTKKCVESVLKNTAYPNYELIFVDNNSSDNTADYLKSIQHESDKIKLVLNKNNRGFAGGNNDGIAVSDGEYILLLNNDTIVTRGWLTNMVKRYRDSAVGVVGPVSNAIGNEAMVNLGYYNHVGLMPFLAYDYTAKHMGEDYPNSGTLAMFCFMFSREVLDNVGPLDENYGIGMFEDDDYCLAVRKAGYKIILAEDVFIHHYGSVSFSKLGEKHLKIFEKNKEYFEKKWNTKWTMHHYRPGVFPEF